MTTTVGRIYYIFLEIDDSLESYMQFLISCEGFVQFEFLSNNKWVSLYILTYNRI